MAELFMPEMMQVFPEQEIVLEAADASGPSEAVMLWTSGMGALTVHSRAAGELPACAFSCRFKEATLPGVALTEFSPIVTVCAMPIVLASRSTVIYFTICDTFYVI